MLQRKRYNKFTQYIINENSHNIFYVNGVTVTNNDTTTTYYTDYTEPDETTVDLRYIEGILIPDNYYYIGKTKDNSGNESIVTVDGNGNLIPKGIGKANVTVRFAGDEIYAPSSATVLITVVNSRVQTSIEVNDTFDLHCGDLVFVDGKLEGLRGIVV